MRKTFLAKFTFGLFGMMIILIETSFSLASASIWDIQTVEHWGDNGTANSIALDSLGRTHISYIEFDYFSGIYYLKYAYWDGNAWQTEYLGQTGDVSPGKTSLVIDSNDRPHICFTYSILGNRPLIVHIMFKGSTWEGFFIDYGASGSLSIDIDDNLHISYSNPYSVIINNVTVPRSDLKYTCGKGQNWQIQTIEYGGRIGEESSMALDSQMRPHIAYRDFGVVNGQLKYASWNGAAWQIQVVDNQGDAGKNPSLVLNSEDRPCISYAGGDYSLKYASHNGTSWQIDTVDTSVALYFLPNSLALSKNDLPRISYQDNGLSILKYALWDGSEWQIEIVDSINSPGLYNSLALDNLDRPHISYYEIIDGDLKYATADIPVDPCECDLNSDGSCNVFDWFTFIEDWGSTNCNEPGVDCECDLNNDGSCNVFDWFIFIEDWGRTDCAGDCECDLNGDGSCNVFDWFIFIEDWGRTDCPVN